MTKLRIWLAINAAWLFVFYNIERINEPLNIAPFVYVMVPVAIGIMALLPVVVRGKNLYYFLVGTAATFVVLSLLTGHQIFNTALPLAVLEIACITISIVLFRHYLAFVAEFESIISKLTFRQLGLPPRLYESLEAEDVYREVRRSRVHEHPLSMLVVEPELSSAVLPGSKLMQELHQVLAKRFAYAQIVNIFSHNLRDIDLMIQHGDGFALVLPETEAAQSEQIVQHVQQVVQEQLGIQLRVGKAAFPENAITLGGLVDYARADLKKQSKAVVDVQTTVKPTEQVMGPQLATKEKNAS
jgi:hypothetical protein